ncbi:3-dehydroquinate synthase [bacterium]|nr:3-dehydroquinate synthase [bacterium]
METKLPDVSVNINEKSAFDYPIFIGENLLKNAQLYVSSYTKASKFLIVTNKTVANLYRESLNIQNAEWMVLEDGEQYKNFDTYKLIMDKALEMRLERKDAFIAFGGGVVGDITGFCAATYLRGIDFIQIPTTLLAQVDSSVGGKVAINTQFGKNLVGAFYQPKLVLADTSTLCTLDKRQFKTGLAEVVKYAFIEKTAMCNFNFLNFLLDNSELIKSKDLGILKEMIKICCEIKARVVNEDEQEKGLRAILNFGHTYAHAIEKVTNYTHFTHGEAVAIGMRLVFDLAKMRNMISSDYYNLAIKLLSKFALTYVLPDSTTHEALVEAMLFDKKVQDNKVRFVLPVDVGKVVITSDVML